VLREGAVANLSDKGDSCETAHVEAFASDSGKSIVEAVWVVIDLVWTNTGGEERV
jgi:hypothetical protein